MGKEAWECLPCPCAEPPDGPVVVVGGGGEAGQPHPASEQSWGVGRDPSHQPPGSPAPALDSFLLQLGTHTLGLLFLPAQSLPVSMATPPNSRFQAR